MSCINWYRRYWPVVGGGIFVFLAFYVGLFADALPFLQKCMIVLYMCLLVHEFEEYVFPGGFPASCNMALFGEKTDIGKYPLNEQSAFVVNVVCAYPLYLVGIFCYQWLWYDVFICYFTAMQFLVHCLKINISLRSWYSPGCATSLLVMLPVGAYVLSYMAQNYDMPHYYWWAPLLCFPLVSLLTILLPILTFRNRETPYGFAPHESKSFDIRHGVAALYRDPKE